MLAKLHKYLLAQVLLLSDMWGMYAVCLEAYHQSIIANLQAKMHNTMGWFIKGDQVVYKTEWRYK